MADSLRVWWLAARPKTLMASVCPVIIGTALASRDGATHVGAALAALIGAIAIQIGTNFCNDYFDFRQGADTPHRKGPTRAVQAGLITPRAMLWATGLTYLVAVVASGYLVGRAGWPLAVVGLVSIGCGIWYTASRFSLAYLGLGDLFVLVFFGPIAVAGTYYVQALRVTLAVGLAGLAPGLLSVAILVVNNLRDVHEDAQANKRTLAVRWGTPFARREYAACMIASSLVPLMLWSSGAMSHWVLLSSLAIVPGFGLALQLGSLRGAALNPYLGKTAGVLLIYTAVFSTTCIWS